MLIGIVIPAASDEPPWELEAVHPEAIGAAILGTPKAIDLRDLGVSIYVDESGSLRGLPFNSRATFLWWFHVPSARQQAVIFGDAVVARLPRDRGLEAGLPAAAVELLCSPAEFRVEVRATGDVKWLDLQMTYPDYWEAIFWGMVLLERQDAPEEVRILPIDPYGGPLVD